MRAAKTYKKFNATINKWEKQLEEYSKEDFNHKPNPQTWSIGQVYEHVVSSTLNFHAKQIEICLLSNDNKNKSKTFIGWLSFIINRIPPIEIKIPPEENIEPQQPQNKEDVSAKLNHVKQVFLELANKIDASKCLGKTNHPGMGYLNAKEWLKVIEMHFRYHEKYNANVFKKISIA